MVHRLTAAHGFAEAAEAQPEEEKKLETNRDDENFDDLDDDDDRVLPGRPQPTHRHGADLEYDQAPQPTPFGYNRRPGSQQIFHMQCKMTLLDNL